MDKGKGLVRSSSATSSLSLISSSSVDSRIASGDDEGGGVAPLVKGATPAVDSELRTRLHAEETSPLPQFTYKQLEDLNSQMPLKSGWLKKCTQSSGGLWKRRWFVLRGDGIYYYKDNKEYKVQGIYLLLDVVTVAEVRLKQQENVFALVTAEKTVFLQCSSREEVVEWVRLCRKQWKRVRGVGIPQVSTCKESGGQVERAGHHRDESEYDRAKLIQQRSQILSDNRPMVQGFLEKLRTSGFNANTWTKKWIVLRNGQINIYKNDKEYLLQRLVPLTAVLSIVAIDPVSKSHEFCFKIILPRRTIILCANSARDRDLWVETLTTVHSQMVMKNCITDEGLDSDC